MVDGAYQNKCELEEIRALLPRVIGPVFDLPAGPWHTARFQGLEVNLVLLVGEMTIVIARRRNQSTPSYQGALAFEGH